MSRSLENPPPGRTPIDHLDEVYDRLRQIAARLAQGSRLSVPATAVVHEAWLRLTSAGEQRWPDRKAFASAAARAIRWVLVDRARRRLAASHQTSRPLSLQEAQAATPSDRVLVELDDALREMKQRFPRAHAVVQLRRFGGLSVAEVATVLAVSTPTVKRDWHFARAWLLRAMTSSELP